MPTYAYRCAACAHEFDAIQRFSDASLIECPQCGGVIRRVFQPVGVVFKGSGWYINDSRGKSSMKSNSATDSSNKSETTTDVKSTADSAASSSTSESSTSSAKPAAD